MADNKNMTQEEIDWVNEYHAKVYSELSPLLNAEEQEWLKSKTQKI